MNYLTTYLTLGAVLRVVAIASLIIAAWLFAAFVIAAFWHFTKQASLRARYQRAIDEHPVAVANALISAVDRDREKPHETYAWGPADRLPQADYVTVRVIDDCGCLRWLIHPDGFVEPAYGPCPADAALAEVEQSRRPR